MRFIYDLNKSLSNKLKHGIDFEEAKSLWDDSSSVQTLSNFVYEERFIVIGKIDDKHWSAVITYRNLHIRIISVRRSRKKEVKIYEENYSQGI